MRKNVRVKSIKDLQGSLRIRNAIEGLTPRDILLDFDKMQVNGNFVKTTMIINYVEEILQGLGRDITEIEDAVQEIENALNTYGCNAENLEMFTLQWATGIAFVSECDCGNTCDCETCDCEKETN